MGLGWSLGPGPISSGTKIEDSTTVCICARISENLKPEAVVHHYLSEHHTHFQVCRIFLLLLWWRAELRTGKSHSSTWREKGSPPRHSNWNQGYLRQKTTSLLLQFLISEDFRSFVIQSPQSKMCGGHRFHHPPFNLCVHGPAHSRPDPPVLFWAQYLLHKSQ